MGAEAGYGIGYKWEENPVGPGSLLWVRKWGTGWVLCMRENMQGSLLCAVMTGSSGLAGLSVSLHFRSASWRGWGWEAEE